jgi:DNA-binding MarR family transcriptional regulator
MTYNGPEKFTVRQLAAHLYISLAGAYRVINALYNAGMIESQQDPNCRRRVWYKLKPQAKERV